MGAELIEQPNVGGKRGARILPLDKETARAQVVRSYIFQELEEDARNPGDRSDIFPPDVDRFLRIVHTVSRAITFKDHEDFCNSCYRMSFEKIITNASTYTADAYVRDVLLLEGKVAIPPAKNIKSYVFGYPLQTQRNEGDIRYRVYLNPRPQHAVAVYRGLLDGNPPIVWSKLADHELLITCRDALVVYVASGSALAEILARLRSYQWDNSDHFFDEVPVMTKPADDLAGVGWAVDLPMTKGGGHVYAHWEAKGEEWQRGRRWIMDGTSADVNLSHSQWRSIFVLSALRKSAKGDISALRTELARIGDAAGLAPQAMFARPTIGPELVTLLENELFPEVTSGS
ncbi:hypothetical protein FB559_3599 [Actinoallomurus bryophytorum]|uniref:Uncharacterized protein n=2 Tax=Actinoallomurus bryophytorum TaxID=1490222 RepID=A0A543CM39_9ACTN|nr:hypothetical protein FB559_3599 [Actinoallomurus bryophytorum]